MDDAAARFVKKVGPSPLQTARDRGAPARPLSPIRRAALPLGSAAAAVLAIGVGRCVAHGDDAQLTRVPDIYLEPLTVDTSTLTAAASASAPPIIPVRRVPLAGIPARHWVDPPRVRAPPIPERAHDGPQGIIVLNNEGALR